MWHKKINLVHRQFFIFSFYITHYHHVDLLRSVPENKETLTMSYSLVWYIPRQLLSKSFSRKKVSYYLGLMFVKLLRGAHFSNVAGLFLANFAKSNSVTGIFQGIYRGLKQFSIVFNISRRLSNGRFRKF